jgi:hypothetical protein
MTIKVYMTDGRIEEFPNAYISWEWDDNEEGTDSGFRIHSMDKMMNSVNAFVYPGECEKIEITSEESDRVFKSAPSEGGISGELYRILLDVSKRCKQQNDNKLRIRTWINILMDRVYGNFNKRSSTEQREELLQVAAEVIQVIKNVDEHIEANKNDKYIKR